MALINEHYLKLQKGYLFPEIAKRVKLYAEQHPDAKILRLGIGDVTLPLNPLTVQAFKDGVDEMALKETFKGYGPEQGYAFLREAIVKHDFATRSVNVHPDEIFVSDGSKCDTGNIQEIFSTEATVAIADPAYPVYVDTNVMAGRTGAADSNGLYSGIVYLPCTESAGFKPSLPSSKVDIIYLCCPNNPTGTVLTREELKTWVDFAREHRAVIFFDAAYEAFITDSNIPHSIYEIEGAREVSIEFRSFSKNAGFTGTRLAYTVVPKELMGYTAQGTAVSIHQLWTRRHTTKFNGVSYPVQKAGLSVYSDEGQKSIRQQINYYMENARNIHDTLKNSGFTVFGGKNAPYIWLKTRNNLSSWEFFDLLLNECQVVGTPGSGFGPSGEGYFRLSAFGARETVVEALSRIQNKFNQ